MRIGFGRGWGVDGAGISPQGGDKNTQRWEIIGIPCILWILKPFMRGLVVTSPRGGAVAIAGVSLQGLDLLMMWLGSLSNVWETTSHSPPHRRDTTSQYVSVYNFICWSVSLYTVCHVSYKHLYFILLTKPKVLLLWAYESLFALKWESVGSSHNDIIGCVHVGVCLLVLVWVCSVLVRVRRWSREPATCRFTAWASMAWRSKRIPKSLPTQKPSMPGRCPDHRVKWNSWQSMWMAHLLPRP